MDESAQTEPGWYTGPYRGLGIPHWNAAVRGRAAVAVCGIGDRACGGVPVEGRIALADAAYVTINTPLTPTQV